MTNDLDNDASKRNFIKKEYEKLEGRVSNATSRTQLALIIADAGSLALMASQLGIDIGILELIATAVSKTLDYETTEQIQVVDFNEGIRLAKEQEKLIESIKFKAFIKLLILFMMILLIDKGKIMKVYTKSLKLQKQVGNLLRKKSRNSVKHLNK
ncbi:MAG: hypothetical protein PV347_06330 [Rickettsiaceae bacterium]|nr:hypothetical protein [Rickettsiaceae bacterium]MDD9337354.1 hypothetical protein [Rickettsiaceae bacterium]